MKEWFIKLAGDFSQTFIEKDRWMLFLKGFSVTIRVAVLALLIGIVIGIIVAVLNQVLIRSGREEQAMMTTLAGLIVVMMLIVQKISELFTLIQKVFGF